MLIRGAVRTADGSPIEGAVVVIVEAPVDVPDIGAMTGDDGAFVVGAPAAGRYRLGVRADGHAAREFELDVVDDVTLDAVLE